MGRTAWLLKCGCNNVMSKILLGLCACRGLAVLIEHLVLLMLTWVLSLVAL